MLQLDCMYIDTNDARSTNGILNTCCRFVVMYGVSSTVRINHSFEDVLFYSQAGLSFLYYLCVLCVSVSFFNRLKWIIRITKSQSFRKMLRSLKNNNKEEQQQYIPIFIKLTFFWHHAFCALSSLNGFWSKKNIRLSGVCITTHRFRSFRLWLKNFWSLAEVLPQLRHDNIIITDPMITSPYWEGIFSFVVWGSNCCTRNSFIASFTYIGLAFTDWFEYEDSWVQKTSLQVGRNCLIK